MKPKTVFLSIIIITIYLFSFQISIPQNFTTLLAPNAEQQDSTTHTLQINSLLTNNSNCWTVLVYMSANNNLEQFAVSDVKEMLLGSIGVSSCVRFLLQIDRSNHSNATLGYSNQQLPGQSVKYSVAMRYEISNGSLIPLTSPTNGLGRINMGNKLIFENFLLWGMSSYPANHTVLIVWGYGSHSGSIGFDESNNTELSPSDLHSAVQSAESQTHERIDVIGFDASFMASANVLISLHDVTDIILASESQQAGQSWNYEQIFGTFKVSPLTYVTPSDWAGTVIRSYHDYYQSINGTYSSLGEFNTFYLNTLIQTLHDFSNVVIDQLQNSTNNANFIVAQALELARNESVSFSYNLIDLYHFMTVFQTFTRNSYLKQLANAVITAIHKSINDITVGSILTNTSGISINFSPNQYYFSNLPSYSSSIFSTSTNWDQMLNTYYDISSNQSYISFLMSNPVQNTLLDNYYITIAPIQQNSSSNSIMNFIVSRTQTFSYNLTSTFPYSTNGSLLIYQQTVGDRIQLNPSFTIPLTNIVGSSAGIFNFTFQSSGFMYLKAEFIPTNQNFLYGSSPFRAFTQDFYFANSTSLLIPIAQDNGANTFITGSTISFHLSLFNAEKTNYPGGSLDILIFNQSTNTIYDTKTVSIGPITGLNFSNITINLPSINTANTFTISLLIDNNSLLSRFTQSLTLFPNTFSIVTPAQQLSATILFNGYESYQIASFFSFDSYNFTPSIYFFSPTSPSGFGDINFSLSISDQYSTVYSKQGVILNSNWKFFDGLYNVSSLSLGFNNASGSIFSPGTLYKYNLLTNVTGNENLLDNSFYFQPFLSSLSHIIITNFYYKIDYKDSKWYINTTLRNLGNISTNNSYDYSSLSIYSLSRTNYFTISRKDIGTGLPDIPGNSSFQDNFVISLNPDSFPIGDVVLNYNYYNSLGSYDVQQQTVMKHSLITHDHKAPILSLSIPQTVTIGVPFTSVASISDANPFTYSIILNSQIMETGLININGNKVSSSNVVTYSISRNFLFSKIGVNRITITVSDSNINQSVIVREIIAQNPSNTTITNPSSIITSPPTNPSYSSSTNVISSSTISSKSSNNKTSPFILIPLFLFSFLSIVIIRKIRKTH